MTTHISRRMLFSTLFAIQIAAALADAQTVTFDDLPSTGGGVSWKLIPNGYAGLQWNNFGVLNGAIRPAAEGYHNGVVSASNVAFNLGGAPASISSATPFNVESAYLAEAAANSMVLRIQGWAGTTLAYNHTYSLSTTGAALIHLGYVGVDRVVFTPPANQWLVLDNLTLSAGDTNASACSFTLSPTGTTHGSGVETGSVSVTTSAGCAWAVQNNNTWVTILSSVNNSNSGTVTYRMGANARNVARSGTLNIGGQSFAINQSAGTPPTTFTPVDLGTAEVSTIGHAVYSSPGFPGMTSSLSVVDFLIDQNQSSGGGAPLPAVSVNWDTNIQFVLKVSAPAGHKILVQPPSGHAARLTGFLWWRAGLGGGTSPVGPVEIGFENLEGTAPDFAGSDAVLSSSHGFFGFSEITSTAFSDDLAFTSMTLTGTVTSQYTGYEIQNFTSHPESALKFSYATDSTNDIRSFVSIVPIDPSPSIRIEGISSDGVALSVRGRAKQAGQTVVIESSENLIQWTAISTNAVPCSIMDTAGRNAPMRFYRTRELP